MSEYRYFRNRAWGVDVASAERTEDGWTVHWLSGGGKGPGEFEQQFPSLTAMRRAGFRERHDVYPCCGEIGGCGGPCARFPCWELTT